MKFICKPPAAVVIFLAFITVAYPSAATTVDPGDPDHFDVQVGPEARAGREFALRLVIRDVEGNRVTGYDQLDRTIRLTTTGEEELSRTEVSSEEFEDGELTVYLTYSRAEEIRVTAREVDHVARGRSDPVRVKPGSPSDFEVQLPTTAEAGQPFALQLQAVDAHGNKIEDYSEQTSGVTLETTGAQAPAPAFIEADRFQEGRLSERITYENAEQIQLRIIDQANEIEVLTPEITISPSELAGFTVTAPEESQAGESFQVALEAEDDYGNIVEDYAGQGDGVELEFSGDGDIQPDFVSPEEFEAGVAFISSTLTRAESGRITARDIETGMESESNRISVGAGTPVEFSLEVPGEVVAGEEFEVELVVLDEYDNIVREFDRHQEAVLVGIADQMDKKEIQPDEFDRGRTSVQLSHRRAEQIRVEAGVEELDISSRSRNIRVQPGQPGDLVVSTPEEVPAGEEFTVELKLIDAFENTVTSPEQYEGEVRVALINRETSEEKSLPLSAFHRGEAQVEFVHQRAEQVNVFAEYDRFELRTRSEPVSITPAEFAEMALETPGRVTAGEEFTVNVQLLDEYGNPLEELPAELEYLRPLSSTGGQLQPRKISRQQMSAPSFELELTYREAETIRLQLVDSRGESRAESALIQVKPAEVAEFELEAPLEVRADREFPLRLKALDEYRNVVENLDNREGEIALASSGEGTLQPQTLQFRRFVDGVAEINATYRRAEDIVLFATSGDIEARSDSISVVPGAPGQYEVSMQPRVRAGEPFPAEVTVYDDYENQINELPADFPGVELEASGEQRISPARLDKSLFKNGSAAVKLIYPRTGRLQVAAEKLEETPEESLVDRLFLRREVDSLNLYIVSSAEVPLKHRPRSDRESRIKLAFQPANLAGDEVSYSFEDWFLRRISQSRTGSQNFPGVEVEILPEKPVEYETERQQNLVELTVEAEEIDTHVVEPDAPPVEEPEEEIPEEPEEIPEEPEEEIPEEPEEEEDPVDPEEPEEPEAEPEDIPELSEVQALIEEEEYDRALQKLDIYLEENPDDEQAVRLRHRLERIREVLD